MILAKFKSIQTNLIFWFLFLALVPLLMGILITFNQQKNSIQQESFNKLTAIRDLKVQQLEAWIDERIGDVYVMSGDFEIRSLEYILKNKKTSSLYIEKTENARKLLNRYLQNYTAYEEVFFINASTGIVALSTKMNSEGKNQVHNPYFTIPLETGKVYIKDIFSSNSTQKPSMTISVPVYCLEHNIHIIGIIVARINLENSLYNLLQNRIGLGETGETLIVNEDVLALSELRWHENAPLSLQVDAIPAIRAAEGKTGITEAIAYNGEKMLAAYTYIPKTKWGFVAKQDLSELNEPIRALTKNLILLFIISAILIILIAVWISKRISKPIIEMDIVTQKIKEGDYSEQVNVDSENELGFLADSINEMTSSIQSRSKTQKAVAVISGTMIGQSSMKEFGNGILKQFMDITGANMATFYILNEINSEYEHFTSIGANEKLLKSFSSINPEGEFGNAISKKKIVSLQNIPDDSPFHFNTTAGNLIPKEILTIPVLIDNTVVAIISLINIHPFDKECFDILNQSWASINTAYSNLLASERTRVLAESLSRTNQQLEAQSEELQEQSEELQGQTEELQHTSEELQEQNLELEAQKNQVEEANRLKSEFLSNMSHELRTPLNSINALSQVLGMQAKDKLNEEENNYLEIIERNGKRLLSLINSILDLSKIESGKMDISPQSVSIKSLLTIIRESMQSLADKRDNSIELNITENLPTIETDESRMHQVLLNIISNSVKFTEKGSVSISAKQEKENVIVKVKDTGIGISAEMLPSIFDEFRQVDGSSSRQFEGTGLGLAIAHKLINVLGGNITVKSKLGVGSEFSISFPLKWHGETIIDYTTKLESKLFNTVKNTILVVDDDPKVIKNISEYLKKSGYDIISTTSGKEAITLAEKYQPYAITLDIIMPEMDGWEVLQKLKLNPKTSDIPVIVISVSNERDTGYALGASGYINKPVDKQVLISEIRKLNEEPETVMIVDDNELELKHMAEIIEAENIETILAHDGEESIKLIAKKNPDILVLDLLMPGMDGFQVLEQIRKNPETQNLPVIVVTAKDITEDDKMQLSGKVSTLITKSSTTPQDLYKEINRILKKLNKSGNIRISDNENPRILIVEDNEDAIIQIKSILEKEEYTVDVANGGQEALDYIQHTVPDGIILDLMMPDIDGFEVLEKLRSTELTNNIPVIILTAKDLTHDDLSKLSNNNIQQLIHKGDVDVEGLLSKVEMMLGAGRDEEMIKGGNDKMSKGINDKMKEKKGEGNDKMSKGVNDKMEEKGEGNDKMSKGVNDKMEEEREGNAKMRKGLNDKMEEEGEGNEEMRKGINDKMKEKEKRKENEKGKGKGKGMPNILVVEDNPDNMTTVKAILKGKYTVLEAVDGKQGISMAKSQIPDMILLDMSLPNMTGDEVIKILKENKETKNIPIIAVTAQAMKGDKEKILGLGFDGYVAKPIEAGELIEMIEKFV